MNGKEFKEWMDIVKRASKPLKAEMLRYVDDLHDVREHKRKDKTCIYPIPKGEGAAWSDFLRLTDTASQQLLLKMQEHIEAKV